MTKRQKCSKEEVDDLEVLNRKCLMHIAKRIPSDIHDVLIQLEVPEYKIEAFMTENIKITEKAFNCLYFWIRNRISSTSCEDNLIRELKTALADANRQDLVNYLDEEVKKRKPGPKKMKRIFNESKEPFLQEDDNEDHSEEESDESDDNGGIDDEEENDDNDDKKEETSVSENKDEDSEDDDESYSEVDDEDEDNDSDDSDNGDEKENEDGQQKYLTAKQCIVAGVSRENESSSSLLLTLNARKESYREENLKVRVESLSIVEYGIIKPKKKMELLIHDKSTFIRGAAFEDHCTVLKPILLEGKTYQISNFKIKESNNFPFHREISLLSSSKIRRSPPIPKVAVNKFSINDIKSDNFLDRLVVLGGVVVAAISEKTKPKKKYLQKVLLMDASGEIIMNIWHETKTGDCKLKPNKTLEMHYVSVGKFNGEFYLTETCLTKKIKLKTGSAALKKLVSNDASKRFQYREMSIPGIYNIKNGTHRVSLSGIRIITFRKERESPFIHKVCNVAPEHGQLITDNYCTLCKKKRRGDKKVCLQAEVFDISNTASVWVTLFDKSARDILGDDYKDFVTYEHEDRVSILKEVEKRGIFYNIDAIVVKDKSVLRVKVQSIVSN